PDAVVRTPAIVKSDGSRKQWDAAEGGYGSEAPYLAECFGPVSFAVAVDSTEEALELLRLTVRDKGAMTVGAYTTSQETERAVEDVCLEE
ncbi:phenylacetic acid degradation protein PaaN, partial [Streptomyces coelicoflavus]